MCKNKSKLRTVVAMAIYLAGFTVFMGCEKKVIPDETHATKEVHF
jgi:hypothetical protein